MLLWAGFVSEGCERVLPLGVEGDKKCLVLGCPVTPEPCALLAGLSLDNQCENSGVSPLG